MPDYSTAFASLDRLIRQKMAAHDTPGLAVAITDRQKLLWQRAFGHANLDAKTPLTVDNTFEIGSIGKSFTCIALLKLQEAGQLDLHAPVSDYLPWLELRSDFPPITPHHLMTHTAGLTIGIDFTPSARYEVWSLHQEAIPYPPGQHFHYSNVGYKLLGFLLEDVSGRPYGELLQEWILDPLGLADSDALTTHDSRRRLAVGYERFYDDRPWHRSHPMMPAPWFEYGAGDGSPVCTAADLAAYLRLFLNEGRAETGPILSEESFQLMTREMIEAREDHYGYGLFIKEIDGRKYVGHNGGTIGYLATLLADLDGGAGVVILTNGPAHSDKDAIAEYALGLLHAARSGTPPPEPPPSNDPIHLENAADFAGRYQAENKTITLKAEGNQLMLVDGQAFIILEKRGEDIFQANHPDLALFLLSFQRQQGQVVSVFHGADIYVKEGSDWTPEVADYPETWEAYLGHYRSHDPWFTNFRVFLRGGKLFTTYKVYQDDFEEPLLELEEGLFQVGEAELTPERLRFDTIVNGQAQRAHVFGGDYYRFFTP
jgi:CubicO group peptidase (beta-lactamase class C family)